jgi:hypothetical protein
MIKIQLKKYIFVKFVFSLKFSFYNISSYSILLFKNLKIKIKDRYFLRFLRVGILKNPNIFSKPEWKSLKHYI